MTVGASGDTLSAPHSGSSAAESDSLAGVDNEFYAAVMAMAAHGRGAAMRR